MTVRSFLADDDLTPAEQTEVLDLALAMKAEPFARRPFAGPRSVGVLLDKPTLRTQTSFQAGIAELGGNAVMVDGRLAGVGTRESIADCARILGRQVSALVWRTGDQSRIDEMAAHAGIPVVNALTDQFHPCQVLADLLTIREHRGPLAGTTFAYVGDGSNNMAASYLLGGATAGMHVRIGTPSSYRPSADVLTRAEAIAAATGGSITVVSDPRVAVADATAVATDTWISMGQEGDQTRLQAFNAHTLNAELLSAAHPEAIVLHCLPAYRGKEITAEVLDGPRSVIWDEAENRRHVQKAVLAFLDDHAGGGS